MDVLTVPLGGLAGAYLEAIATLDDDRMGNVSAFVAVASQLILIKSRALLPRRAVEGAVALADEGPDPEAELRARLILYRAFRDAGSTPARGGPAAGRPVPPRGDAARVAGLAGARPPAAAPLPTTCSSPRSTGSPGWPRRPPRRPRPSAARSCSPTAPQLIRHALRGADVVVLQDLLKGVHDRVVVAVTFLAMLELMKRREIVVEQTEPWGPIMARRTTPEERAAAGDARRHRRGGTPGRVAGVVRMTEEEVVLDAPADEPEPVDEPAAAASDGRRPGRRADRGRSSRRSCSSRRSR